MVRVFDAFGSKKGHIVGGGLAFYDYLICDRPLISFSRAFSVKHMEEIFMAPFKSFQTISDLQTQCN